MSEQNVRRVFVLLRLLSPFTWNFVNPPQIAVLPGDTRGWHRGGTRGVTGSAGVMTIVNVAIP